MTYVKWCISVSYVWLAAGSQVWVEGKIWYWRCMASGESSSQCPLCPVLPTLYHHIPSSSAGVNFLPPRRRLLVMGSRGQIPSRTTIMGQVRILRTWCTFGSRFCFTAQRSPSGKCIFVEDVLPYVPNSVFFSGQHCHETPFAASNRGTAEATTSECCTPGTNLSLKLI